MQQKWSNAIAYTTRGVVSVVILLTGVGVFQYFKATRPEVPRSQAGQSARLVEIMVAEPVATTRVWEGYGTAEARFVADVASEVAALVRDRPADIEPGRAVRRGQTLIELDASDYLAQQEIARRNVERFEAQLRVLGIEERNWNDQLELARQELEVAKREYESARDALDRDAGSPIEVDRRRREYTASLRVQRQIEEEVEKVGPRRADLQASIELEKARLAMAGRDLARCTITSPFDGVLQFVSVREGERVTPGAVVARVVNLELIRIPLQLPQSAQGSVRVGDVVELRAEALGWCWTGQIDRLAPEANALTRTLVAFAEVTQDPAAEPLLNPGRFLRASVASTAVERLVVPRRALLGDALMIDDAGVASRRIVNVDFHTRATFPELHPTEQEWVVLAESSGLQRGERVILSNVSELRPGETIASMDALDGPRLSRSAPAAASDESKSDQ